MMIHVVLLFNIVYGGLPISYPGIKNSDLGGKLVPYNLIDTNPSCYARGFCPMFPPGGRLSAFPNSEEKYQMILHNFFRQFGDEAVHIKYGKWAWGANKNGGLTKYCFSCTYCGETDEKGAPLYWYSDANQAARFKQYDENSCNSSWYRQPGEDKHSTCKWVLPEYGGGSHCDLFRESCDMGFRAVSFCRGEDRCWFETEGICGGNSCVTDGHCDPIFARKYDYQGTGFVEGMNGAATTYSRFTKTIYYLLPMGAHFDERTKVVEEDENENMMHFTLWLEYFDANHTQTPLHCWSLYAGAYHEMEVLVSEVGDLTNGFSRDSYSVMFTSVHPPVTRCRPYAFICKTSLNNFVRLPEDGDYYFGTEWIDWKYTNFSSFIHGSIGYTCKENHYYHDGTQWIVNGGPTLNRCDIWYYQDTTELRSGDYSQRTTCNGCEDLDQLDCWAACVYSDFAADKCQCSGITGPDYGNEWCDPALNPTQPPTPASESPTPSPTPVPVAAPTRAPITPIRAPTRAPIAPTGAPTEAPTPLPTPLPTQSPLRPGLTHSPSPAPTPLPTISPLEAPIIESTRASDSGSVDSLEIGNESPSTASPSGGIAAAVVLGLVCVVCVAAYVYFRKKSGKPLYPSSLTLPQISSTLSHKDSQISRQLSQDIRTPSVVQMRDDDEGEGGAFPHTKGLPPPEEDIPPVSPLHADTVNEDAYSYVSYGQTNMQAEEDVDDKKTPLSGNFSSSNSPSSIKMKFPPPVFMSIEDAKQIKGADREKFLNDEDFVSVFHMRKDEFYKLPGWKQKAAKKKTGFF